MYISFQEVPLDERLKKLFLAEFFYNKYPFELLKHSQI